MSRPLPPNASLFHPRPCSAKGGVVPIGGLGGGRGAGPASSEDRGTDQPGGLLPQPSASCSHGGGAGGGEVGGAGMWRRVP